GLKLNNLPEGAIIATSSIRRRAQLLSYRPDLKIIDIRGNIETRIKKFLNNEMHGLILAAAGLIRLGLQKYIQEIIDPNIMLPAPAQGIIAIQIRDDSDFKSLVQEINHSDTFRAAVMERAFLQTFKGGCQSPISAFCERISDQLFLKGKISNLDGSKVLTATVPVEPNDNWHTGTVLAHKMLQMGAEKILEENHEGK
ncbi:MAG: hydroxymethylbilane synthase, partial [Candidatus Humimicrobiaceae bacterium]